jgi:MATE family, multidrug efflux pump
VLAAAFIGIGAASTIGVLFLAVPHVLLSAFGMTEHRVQALGSQLLSYLAVSGLFVTVALTFTGGLQGTGDTKGPLYISIASQVFVPIGICAVLQATRGLQASDVWLAIVIGHFTRATLSVLRFRQGRWRSIVVDIGPVPASASVPNDVAWVRASRVSSAPEPDEIS